jgi:hypothetical protein
VFVGSGCYLTSGILIDKPVTIDGGEYRDPVHTNTGDGTVHPIIRIKDTFDVTIENVVLVGSQTDKILHRALVGQAGLDIASSDNVWVLNVSTINTYGDGMTVWANFPEDGAPTRHLVVDGLTITNAGRQAITVAYAVDSSFNNVNVRSAVGDGWDFESDGPGIGSGNIVISNSTSEKGVRLVEALQGPILFDHCRCERHITLINEAAQSGQLVEFHDGSASLPRRQVGITLEGPGRLMFDHVDLDRLPGSEGVTAPAWSVTAGGHLTLIRSPVEGPQGTNDQSSTVAIHN